MSKPVDFAKQRREQGRRLSNIVREVAGLLEPTAQEVLRAAMARKSEEDDRLTERLQESIVPLFVLNDDGYPERIACCVLVRLDSDFFAFTAAHVIRDPKSARLLAPSGSMGGKLVLLPPCAAHVKSSKGNGDLDVGVLVFPAHRLGPFISHVFLAGPDIDQDDRPDDLGLEFFYMVLGYSASRTQVTISTTERRIHQQSFRCSTHPVEPAEYVQEKMSPADHILLDFDREEMRVKGRQVTAPKLQGVSGGGIFQVSRRSNRPLLVAIATQNRRSSRLIVGTRIKHFLALVREVRTTCRE